MRSLSNTTKRSPCSPPLEKVHTNPEDPAPPKVNEWMNLKKTGAEQNSEGLQAFTRT